MQINSLEEKFITALGSLYDAEQRFLEGQTQMLERVTDETLKTGLQTHIEESQQQVKNLEEVFRLMGQEPQSVPNPGANGMVLETRELMEAASQHPHIVDCIVADAQAKVEHLEMACYRGLVMGAEHLGNQEVVNLLQQNLQQEEKTAQMIEQAIPQLLVAATELEPAMAS